MKRKGAYLIKLLGVMLLCSGLAYTQEAVFEYQQAPNKILEEQRSIAQTFTQVKCEAPIKLFITVGKPYSLTLKGTKDKLENVETIVKGKALIFKSKRRLSTNFIGDLPNIGQINFIDADGNPRSIRGAEAKFTCVGGRCGIEHIGKEDVGKLEAYLTLPTLAALSISSSAIVSIDGLTGDSFSVEVSGLGTVMAHRAKLNTINTSISGSGNIVLDGTANKVNVDVSGSGEVKFANLRAVGADIRFSGAGLVQINAKRNLNVDISGVGRVEYVGNPTIAKKVSGFGKIKRINLL